MKKIINITLFTLIIISFQFGVFAQKENIELEYKKVGDVALHLEVLFPKNFDEGKKHPAIVFYHGGGWRTGNMNAFRRQAKYLQTRGMICVLVEYRIETVHGTTPFESVKDARSAMRFVKENAAKLGIDQTHIVASGGSAGGHLAVSLALLNHINEESDDLSINPNPSALVLFNPVLDTSPKGFGYRKFGKERFKSISPIEYLHGQTPPTLILVGTKDRVLPVEIAEEYERQMHERGCVCSLLLYPEQVHSFFNWGKQPDHEYFFRTLEATDKFLVELGILQGKGNVREFFANL